MKTKMFTFYSQLISWGLLILGFSACSDEPGGGGGSVEYGSPSAKYKVSGKVVSSETSKKPVPRIRVVMVDDVKGAPNEYVHIRRDTAFTDAEGKFVVIREDFPYNKYTVSFEDADGEANGAFVDRLEKIEFKSSDYKGGGNWYKGEAQKDMGTIELTPKPKTE